MKKTMPLARIFTQRRGTLSHDETTPPCRICDEEHVGVHEVSRLMLRGSYGFSAELGCEVFMLDPACDLEFFKMPNGMTAVVVDVRAGLDAAVVAHDECVDMAIGKAKLLIALEEDEFANVEVIDEDDDDDEENNYSTLRRRMNIDRNE